MCVRHKRCTLRWKVENKGKTGSLVRTSEASRSTIPVSPSSINRVSSVHLLLPFTSQQICFKRLPLHPLPHKPLFERHLLKANCERDTWEIACTVSSAGGRISSVHHLLPSTSSQICFKQMPFHPLPHKPYLNSLC
jgi:hypothetical protein